MRHIRRKEKQVRDARICHLCLLALLGPGLCHHPWIDVILRDCFELIRVLGRRLTIGMDLGRCVGLGCVLGERWNDVGVGGTGGDGDLGGNALFGGRYVGVGGQGRGWGNGGRLLGSRGWSGGDGINLHSVAHVAMTSAAGLCGPLIELWCT